jgi:hypothetical protein
MPTYQTQSNVICAYKVQSALGTQASGAGGTVLRMAGGTGAQLTKAATESNEVRRDGMRQRGRHGTQKTTGQWNHEASLGSAEPLLEAIMLDTWSTADLAITEASVLGGSAAATSITTTTSTIVAAAGSWILQGLRVGDIIRLTNHSTPANNSRNLRITALTALTITVAETLTLNATPDTSFTVTRSGKKLIQYSASTLVKRYFTIDEYDIDIDQSTVLTDFVWGSIKFSMAPNGLLMADPGGVGTGQISALATAASPLLTTPTESTATPYSVVDATIRVNGVDVVELTSFDLSLDITPAAPDVFGSGGIKYAPDVFTGQMAITMNLTALRKNLTYLQDFIAETVYSLHVLAVENESEPKDFLSIYVPNFTMGGNTRSSPNKAGGPLTETISIPAALVGKDQTGSGFDGAMIKFQSTGA